MGVGRSDPLTEESLRRGVWGGRFKVEVEVRRVYGTSHRGIVEDMER